MSSKNALRRRLAGPPLMARPQRFGILPTWHFWDAEATRRVKLPIVASFGVLALIAAWLEPWLAVVPTWVWPMVVGLLATLMLGLIEKVLRALIVRRRRELSETQARAKCLPDA